MQGWEKDLMGLGGEDDQCPLVTMLRRRRRCGCEVGEEPFQVSDMRSNAGASERVNIEDPGYDTPAS